MAKPATVVMGFLVILLTLLAITAVCLQGTVGLLPDNHPHRAIVNHAYVATGGLAGICCSLIHCVRPHGDAGGSVEGEEGGHARAPDGLQGESDIRKPFMECVIAMRTMHVVMLNKGDE
jgi:hypothetical protein